MGAADIVPGVSGGTVALILGHYMRLVTAISHLDFTALRLIRQRKIADAWTHFDGRFLLAIVTGMATAILGLASLMHWLLENQFSEVMAVFFGLVLASGLLVGRMVTRWSTAPEFAVGISGAVAWIIASMSPVAGEPSTTYLFACGAIAICAMILPGISGAFVLLLLGAYHPVTGMLHQLKELDISPALLWRLTVFSLGCLTGLALFTRLLRSLLDRYRDVTYAALLGLMLGSLRKLWPLQAPTADTADLEFKDRVYECIAPSAWEHGTWHLAALAAVAAAFVLTLHWIVTSQQSAPHCESQSS